MFRKKILFATFLLFTSCSNVTSTISMVETSDKYNLKPYANAFLDDEINDPIPFKDGDNPHFIESGEVLDVQSNELRFLQINDTHGAINTDNGVIGIDKVATLINELEENNGDYINILGGDIFQGGWLSNQTKGAAFVDIINQINKFDCFVIGNHEFDWGFNTIAKYKDGVIENGELNIPFLGANIYYKGTDTHPSWLDPFTIVNSNGYKVGIIGIIGESQIDSISVDKAQNYEFKNSVKLVRQYSSDLRLNYNCDYVVLATHDYSTHFNEQFAALNNNEKIDAIFCAHTHEYIEDYITRDDETYVPIIQSETKNISAGEIIFYPKENKKPSIKHYFPENYSIDQSISNYIKKYDAIISSGQEQIGYIDKFQSKKDIGEFTTKYLTKKYDTIGAIINSGGVRATLPNGNINRSKALEIFPFDNRILLVKLPGITASKLLNGNSFYLYKDESQTILASRYYYIAVIDYVYINDSYRGYFKDSSFYDTGNFICDDFISAIQEYF